MLRAKEFCKNLQILVFLLIYSSNIFIEAQLNKNSRIVGGATTTVAKHPHMVHLIYDGAPLCGGSLLDEKWVITAAHCVNHHGNEPARFNVRGGATYLAGGVGITRQVEKIIIHSGFNTKTLDKDIAMLKLKEPMAGDNIKTIKLATSLVPNNVMVSVSGWGATKQGGLPSNQLKTVQLKKISLAKCRKRYPKLTVNMLCAEEPSKGKCKGDSGGPMVYNSRLVGLVSWGAGCGNKNSPGVYVNVYQLRTFINNVMKTN